MASLFLFILGTAVGSFINAFVYRLQHGKPVVNARSECPQCSHTLAWHDLIPFISFLILRGKCRYCGKAISWKYFVVELAAGIAFALPVFTNYELRITNYEYIQYIFFASILMLIFAYDLYYLLIPDKISLPAILLVAFAQLPVMSYSLLLTRYFLAALIGFAFFFLQFILSSGEWIGGGDLRLGFLMGLMVGFPGIIAALMLSYIIGFLATLPLLVLGKKRMKSKIPFGVFLTTATIIVLQFGDRVIETYTRLLVYP